MEKLKTLAFELDSELGSIEVTLQTLSDVEKTLGELVDKIEEQETLGYSILRYPDAQRAIRIIWRLMNYTLAEMICDFNEAQVISRKIFESMVKHKK